MVLGIIAGVAFGAVDVGLMLPMSFPDKRAALLGAFTSRFAIGFVIGCVQLPSWPGWLIGLVFGALISLPDAIVTHKYVPILVLGGIGGLIIGGLIHGWRVPAELDCREIPQLRGIDYGMPSLLRRTVQASAGAALTAGHTKSLTRLRPAQVTPPRPRCVAARISSRATRLPSSGRA